MKDSLINQRAKGHCSLKVNVLHSQRPWRVAEPPAVAGEPFTFDLCGN